MTLTNEPDDAETELSEAAAKIRKPRAALLDADAMATTSVLVDEIRELEGELDRLIDHPSRSDVSSIDADDSEEDPTDAYDVERERRVDLADGTNAESDESLAHHLAERARAFVRSTQTHLLSLIRTHGRRRPHRR
ncbi:MAG: hypothetical protein FWD69_08930 [Polyangiaceae bacterium]|nr:hypothetical protein [Polyangiaceae bacterium]